MIKGDYEKLDNLAKYNEFPDMPKHQLCPQCQKWSKRESKTLGGANYVCPTHGKFFVRR